MRTNKKHRTLFFSISMWTLWYADAHIAAICDSSQAVGISALPPLVWFPADVEPGSRCWLPFRSRGISDIQHLLLIKFITKVLDRVKTGNLCMPEEFLQDVIIKINTIKFASSPIRDEARVRDVDSVAGWLISMGLKSCCVVAGRSYLSTIFLQPWIRNF